MKDLIIKYQSETTPSQPPPNRDLGEVPKAEDVGVTCGFFAWRLRKTPVKAGKQ